jgi:hypothetical protein
MLHRDDLGSQVIASLGPELAALTSACNGGFLQEGPGLPARAPRLIDGDEAGHDGETVYMLECPNLVQHSIKPVQGKTKSVHPAPELDENIELCSKLRARQNLQPTRMASRLGWRIGLSLGLRRPSLATVITAIAPLPPRRSHQR